MDARLQALKPGDKVVLRTESGHPNEVQVVAVLPEGIVYTYGLAFQATFFAPEGRIVWPEAPKAKPGVLYRRTGHCDYAYGTTYAFGAPDGRLRNFFGSPFDFTPDWQEVEEP